MSATDSVLSSIDDTLAGYEGAVMREGLDAMRWAPERVICDGGKPLALEPKPVAPDGPAVIVIGDIVITDVGGVRPLADFRP